MEFTEAESNMNDLVSEYQQYQDATAEVGACLAAGAACWAGLAAGLGLPAGACRGGKGWCLQRAGGVPCLLPACMLPHRSSMPACLSFSTHSLPLCASLHPPTLFNRVLPHLALLLRCCCRRRVRPTMTRHKPAAPPWPHSRSERSGGCGRRRRAQACSGRKMPPMPPVAPTLWASPAQPAAL